MNKNYEMLGIVSPSSIGVINSFSSKSFIYIETGNDGHDKLVYYFMHL